MRQVFLDTETTGLNPDSGDRIIEIACVEMIDRRLTQRDLHYYVNPQRTSSDGAIAVHGITDEFLADKPPFAAIARELLDYLAGADVVMHNASFDVAFLDMELKRIGLPGLASHVASVTDTLALARETYPGKSNSLDALCRRLEVDNRARTLHGALLDAGLLAEVYVRMTRGQESLVIDAEQAPIDDRSLDAIDFAQFELIVVAPSADEIAAHAALLAEMRRASGREPVWRVGMASGIIFCAPDAGAARTSSH